MDSKLNVEIVGLIKDRNFYIAKSIAEVKLYFCWFVKFIICFMLTRCFCAQQGLKQKFPEAFLDPVIQPLLEFDWCSYLINKKRVSCVFVVIRRVTYN